VTVKVCASKCSDASHLLTNVKERTPVKYGQCHWPTEMAFIVDQPGLRIDEWPDRDCGPAHILRRRRRQLKAASLFLVGMDFRSVRCAYGRTGYRAKAQQRLPHPAATTAKPEGRFCTRTSPRRGWESYLYWCWLTRSLRRRNYDAAGFNCRIQTRTPGVKYGSSLTTFE
jgi:hypothetical protein